ncbi:hypothetical protein M430DRAFT_14748 [Amorphotheca resinae ATCC 22711]|uniref:Uncharacterized protein n=1 Tax=Amorphotheca resinae ATCC 22711 TaxID=857342 RepID=A0A2T3BDJ2_AMORE|nr:hypothetical protein M430DRAFT_14748 [Amorphotheca resinae ATCC 22711]PSS27477.1 hypothetical protein M430DRAFT_14748 [Amorphotheca resinae ATCC 22711]
MDNTELHNLDLGAPRFLELQVTLVLRQLFDTELLKSTALALVATWPVLSKRINLARTEFLPSQEPELEGLWKERKLDKTFDEAFPGHKDAVAQHVVDSTILNQLVYFSEGLKDQLFPRALTIRVTSLNDACLIHFTVQHPLCDANGTYHIINAYCALLQGKTIEPLRPRQPLKLREENIPNSPPPQTKTEEPTAVRHKIFFSNGWIPLLMGGVRQRINQWRGPKRVERTALIPNFVIDKLAKDAEAAGIRVTKHDLLMAWIYKCTMPEMSQLAAKKAAGPPQFSFVMNVGRLLQQNAEFHNLWLVIPTPDPEVEALPKCPPVIQAASHIRAAIVDARRPAPVQQIIDQHSNVRNSPLGPVDWGCQEPNVVVSSWTNIPLYDLDFVSGDGIHSKPVYVQVGIKARKDFGFRAVWNKEHGIESVTSDPLRSLIDRLNFGQILQRPIAWMAIDRKLKY